MFRVVTYAVIGVFVLSLLASCTSQSATPELAHSPAESAISPAEESLALYEQAEQIYRRSREIAYQFELRGDFAEFPEQLNNLLADPYLSWVRESYDFYKENNWHSPDGAVPEIIIEPYQGASKDGSEVALRSCLDTRTTPAFDANNEFVAGGTIVYQELFFKKFGEELKLFTGTGREVEECPLAT